MKLIYLASPYTHPDKTVESRRFQQACKACAQIFTQGFAVYSPIVHWHCPHKICDLTGGFETFKDLDREMISRSDEVWILSTHGTSESKGIAAEILIARELGKPVRTYRID